MNIEEFKTLKIYCPFCNKVEGIFLFEGLINNSYYCLSCNKCIVFASFNNKNKTITSCEINLNNFGFVYNRMHLVNYYIEVDIDNIINFLRNFDVKYLTEKYKTLELFK